MKRLEKLENEVKEIKEHLGINYKPENDYAKVVINIPENVRIPDEWKEENHFVDDNKKVAVYAPEAWQKEIVAKLWGLKHKDPIGFFKYTIQSLANPEYIGNINKVNGYEFKIISFQDFCKQYGHDGMPEYVKSNWGMVAHASNFVTNLLESPMWKPATKKEYDEQNPKNQKPKEGEYWWLSGLDTSGYWKLGRVKSLPESDFDVANTQRKHDDCWVSSAISISKYFERKMTDNEVEHEISKVAWKLGFVNNSGIKDLDGFCFEIIDAHYLYDHKNDMLKMGNAKIYEKGQFAEIISNSEEPENQIPIHQSWKANIIGDRDDELPSVEEIFDKGYEEGVKDFSQRFYFRVCEIYNKKVDECPDSPLHYRHLFWKESKEEAAQELLEGKLKRQNHDKS